MKFLIFFMLISCASHKIEKFDYLVKDYDGTYLCDELYHGAYGSAAHDCTHVLSGRKKDRIVNPYEIIKVRE